MKEALEVLDNVRLNFSPTGLLAVNITIAFIMFGVALDIKIDHFKDVVMKPKSAILGVISQLLLLPLITFLFTIHLNPIPTVALGMMGGMTIIAAWWGVWHILNGLIISSLWARKRMPQTA